MLYRSCDSPKLNITWVLLSWHVQDGLQIVPQYSLRSACSLYTSDGLISINSSEKYWEKVREFDEDWRVATWV